MRKTIYGIVAGSERNTPVEKWYNRIMVLLILLSVAPLFFKGNNAAFVWIERITVGIFIIDYLMRWLTADYQIEKGELSFFIYPFTPFAIIDLLSILPTFTPINAGLRLLRLLRLGRAFRALRLLRYSRNFAIVARVVRREGQQLLAVCVLAVGYIVLSALIVFQVEPETFPSYMDALYWAAITLTTVGYGDIYPVTDIGRAVGVVSSFVGIAIVALPTGIISAGYMAEPGKGEE